MLLLFPEKGSIPLGMRKVVDVAMYYTFRGHIFRYMNSSSNVYLERLREKISWL